MTKIHVAPELALPIDVVTEKLAFLGRTGSGKTYAALKLAEEMDRVHAQFVALDPVGKWWSLRLAADGVSPGIAIPVFGGLHGDVPLEPTAGKLVADVVADRGISVVLDVSQFESDADKARFAEAFANRFFFRKKSTPSAVHLFIEEAQEFVPQNPQRDEAKMLHAFTRIWKLGRNFGIGGSLLSQRPQEINKKVLNQTELLFCFQMTGPQERKAIDGWIAEKGIDEDISAELPKLARGHAHAWSPAWLQISKVGTFGERWTFDASSTPKVGAKVNASELAPIDLEQLRTDMAATIEKAKADDPRELKKRIAQLEAEVRKKAPAPAAAVVDEKATQRAVDHAVASLVKESAIRDAAVLRFIDRLGTTLQRFVDSGQQAQSAAAEVYTLLASPLKLNGHNGGDTGTVAGRRESTGVTPQERTRTASPRVEPTRRAAMAVAEGLSRTQQRMLDAIAFFESLGTKAPSRAAVAGYCAISHTTGSFSNNLSALRTRGLIEDRGGNVTLTDDGRAAATVNAPPSLGELHDAWKQRLSGTQAAMLDVIIDAHPDEVSREEIAEKLGIQSDTGSFSNNLSKLRTLGLLEDRSRTHVAAGDILFPAGLA